MPDRVMVFIDGSNVYHAFRTVFGSGKYDVAKLASELVADRPNRQLVTAHYYIAAVSREMGEQPYADQQRFLARLK